VRRRILGREAGETELSSANGKGKGKGKEKYREE
jgi:hypothetical protein